ncbi:unnamed protein product [Rotaria magnacalcarata]|uniref:RING-type domain-containing protein n=1 Tax=Rotaria magnacalcarata TaxID=392030 RepID=A0A819Z2U4_9BILA|nr:unnamed protein product [Rotaria magnacalcarata]CAF4162381.1 unnamed protein product [Rotaria magnacalcarata]
MFTPIVTPRSRPSAGDYQYVDEAAVDAELKCSICTRPFQVAASLQSCGHVFCQTCITTWISQQNSCPMCRRIISPGEIKPITARNFINMLDNILVYCLHCNVTNIRRGDMGSHLKKCPMIVISCSAADIKCPWKGPRKEKSKHLSLCIFQQIRPLIETLQTDAKSKANVCNQLRERIDEMDKMLQEQSRFIRAFMNNGRPMSDCCIALSPDHCKIMQHAGGAQNQSTNRLFCSVCRSNVSSGSISLHHCYGGCICQSCIKNYCSDLATIQALPRQQTMLEFRPRLDASSRNRQLLRKRDKATPARQTQNVAISESVSLLNVPQTTHRYACD